MRTRIFSLCLAIAIAFISFPATAEEEKLDEKKALALSQAALGKNIGDATLTDTTGRTVRLSEYRGKPLVLNFIYSSCAHSCGVMTTLLADAFENARKVLGPQSFNAISIGFDTPNDTPARMRAYARKQSVEGTPGWRFLSADATTASMLMERAGFSYAQSAKGFDHLDQVTVIDGNGEIITQVYGATFEKPLLIEPLKALVFGTAQPFHSLGDLIKKVRLFCTLYDPKTDRYLFDYSLFIQIASGFLVIGGVIIFLIREVRNSRRLHNNKERSA
ncbi:MAG: redoxin domain-containing protein [Alphaproteobacteria bacterium]|jgi:protein SCO1|nr:redoxin domain-containing protein [Alphaproteobacteria bacterium]